MDDGGLRYKKRRVFYFAGLLYGVAVTTIVSLLLYRIEQMLEQKASFQQLPDYDALVQFDPERESGHLWPNLNMNVQVLSEISLSCQFLPFRFEKALGITCSVRHGRSLRRSFWGN